MPTQQQLIDALRHSNNLMSQAVTTYVNRGSMKKAREFEDRIAANEKLCEKRSA